jgi:hypothetical protein
MPGLWAPMGRPTRSYCLPELWTPICSVADGQRRIRMTIFEFIESRGWKHYQGRWYLESMAPEAATLELRDVIERVVKEDCESVIKAAQK